VVETLKLIIPQQDTPARRLIGFRNGVLDTATGTFSPHHKSHWLRTLCDVDFTPPVEGKRWKPTRRISGAGLTVPPVADRKNAT
jgi:putative DNA primase/helicase